MLIKMLLTPESARRISNAFLTVSGVAPLKKLNDEKREKLFLKLRMETYPPTSRKLAGLPPCNERASIVAMARPAPFTKQPMLPSSLMKLRLAR